MAFHARAIGKARQEAYAIQDNLGFDKLPNSLALVPTKQIMLPDGTILEWSTNRVIFKPRDKTIAAKNYASSLADIMDDFTRIANRQILGLGKVIGISKERTKDVDKVLTAMGIDTRKDFYVNGKKFYYDSKSGEFKFKLESAINGKFTVREVSTGLTYKGKAIAINNKKMMNIPTKQSVEKMYL